MLISNRDILEQKITALKQQNYSVGFVPTMGALHAGHLSLINTAKQQGLKVIVSVFVNPTQFAPHEDFERYPRPKEKDLGLIEKAGAEVAFFPDVETIYPVGEVVPSAFVDNLRKTKGLESEFRPHFFGGVVQVVKRLFDLVQPDVAFFGEKDFQQLQVIREMVDVLRLPVIVQGVTTLRESDGLAFSSRNSYLNGTERQIAPVLHAVLQDCANGLKAGQVPLVLLTQAKETLLDAGFLSVDYLSLYDAVSWTDLSTVETPLTPQQLKDSRLLTATFLGKTRLIDNIQVA